MVTPISVSVTAVDNATKIFQRVNANMERMQAPVKNLQRSFDRFSQLAGMNRLNEGFSRVRASATSTFRVMGQIAPVLGTITSAASIAGMARLSTNWANFGSNLQSTSQRLGMSVSGLHSWQNGARLAGVSAESMTAAIGNFQENIWNARGGRNPQFVSTLNAIHVAMNNVDGSARSTQAIMGDVANVFTKIKDPVAQATLATAVFGSAGNAMLPFLREGAEGMERYRREALKYGVMNEAGANAANRLRMAQARMTMSVEGFGNSLAQSIEPVLTPIIENMARWIAVNRGWISQNIAGYVQQFANYLKSINWQQVSAGAQQVWNSVKQFTQTIQENIDKIGGFKAVMEIVAVVLGVKVASSVFSMISPFASLAMTITRLVIPAAFSLVTAIGSLLGPVTLIALALVGAAVYIIKHWDPMKSWSENICNIISGAFTGLVNGVKKIFKPFYEIPMAIYKAWDPTKSYFDNLINSIMAVFAKGWEYIKGIMDWVASAVDTLGSFLGKTKDTAKEVQQVMKNTPSFTQTQQIYTNDNGGASVKNGGWIGSWFKGGSKEKDGSNSTNQQINKMTGQVSNLVTSLTDKVERATRVPASPSVAAQASVASNVASNNDLIPTVKTQSNIIQTPIAQQAQKASKSVATNNNNLNNLIEQARRGTNVSLAQGQALAMTESSGRWQGNSKSSAIGFMQLLQGTAKDLGVNRYDPYENVLGGIKYYQKMLKKVGGNSIAAYGAYHDGPDSDGVKQFLASGGTDFSRFSKYAKRGMGNFQNNLSQANGGLLQFNQAIPQGIAANNNNIQATMPSMPNMSNVASVTPITANSGLGQLDGGGGVTMPSMPAIGLPQINNSPSEPQKIVLEIEIKGKPQGMDVKAKSRSPSLTVDSIHYQRAMDETKSASGF